MTQTVILDRDGVINIDFGYVSHPEQLELIPGSAQAIAKLCRAGFTVSIYSNQSAVGRGWAKIEDINATNQALIEMLLESEPEAVLTDICVCPHSPADGCSCRKPKLGLIADRIKSGGIDPKQCWVVGDKLSDLKFGENFGVDWQRLLLVRSGHGAEELEKATRKGEPLPRVCNDLASAAEIIISEYEGRVHAG